MNEPHDPPPADAGRSPVWSPTKRLAFRFVFAYLVLYIFPFPLTSIPGLDAVAEPYSKLWKAIVHWAGKIVFRVDTNTQPSGSGDTTFNYVHVLCILLLAATAAAVWTLLDRRRPLYARLHEWLRVYVRFDLAVTLVGYGAFKVIKSQFPSPSLDRLVQPFGDASPMGLLWTFMGASPAYNVFSGACEMVGGMLLTLRRTTLLGALLTIAVMANVVMLNFSYDVPVKLYSLHLLLMAVFLAAPDLGRLADFFLRNRRAAPAPIQPLFSRRWLHRGTLAVRTVFIAGVVGLALWNSYQASVGYGDRAPKPPFYGIWNVEVETIGGQVRPPLTTDAARWRRVIFSYPESLSIQLMNDSRHRYTLELDPAKKTLGLSPRQDPRQRSTFTYRQPAPGLLELDGTLDHQTIHAELRRVNESSFQLLNRGFHWINEYPFNR